MSSKHDAYHIKCTSVAWGICDAFANHTFYCGTKV